MNRRGFLAALLGGAVLDPERLLWRPGAKLISIPSVSEDIGYNVFNVILTPQVFSQLVIMDLKLAITSSTRERPPRRRL